MANRKKPTHEIRHGAIRASIWTNENRDGSRWFTLTLGRMFKDSQDRWQVASHYKQQHLTDLARAVAAAQKWIEQSTIAPGGKLLVGELLKRATHKRHENLKRSS